MIIIILYPKFLCFISIAGDEEDRYFCMAEPSHCAHFGLDFVCEDPNGGDFGPCENGTKVKCASPPALPLAAPTPANHFRVINYNIWELRYLYYQTGQRERTCRILREVIRLHPDVDAIVFNEVFMGGCFAIFNTTVGASVMNLRDILVQYGFVYFTKNVGETRELPKFENGGVFIASRWPITKYDSVIYTSSVPLTADALSAKGSMYARIEKTIGEVTKTYHVLGTHLQATGRPTADEVRVNQSTEMHELMLKQNISPNEPVIYAGDLNCNNGSDHAVDVIGALDATVPRRIGERIYTSDGEENDLKDSTGKSWIDYALYSNLHRQPSSATIQVVRPMSPEPFEVCMTALATYPVYPNSSACLETTMTQDLADHYAVMGVFEYDDLDEPSTYSYHAYTKVDRKNPWSSVKNL